MPEGGAGVCPESTMEEIPFYGNSDPGTRRRFYLRLLQKAPMSSVPLTQGRQYGALYTVHIPNHTLTRMEQWLGSRLCLLILAPTWVE